MCNSKDGKRGWFYRGRWMKLECWRHKPQKWKRIAWFLHRTFKGFLANDYNYEDNCNDAEYWESYYSGKSPVSSSNRSTQGTQAFKDVINVDNRKGSSFSATTSENYSEIAGYVKVPIFWRFIHCLPMLGGIDLDELDRHLRQKNHDDPFVIPGLQIALNLDQVNEHRDANSFFKPDYRISSVPSKKAAVRPRLSESNRNSSASSHKNHSPSHSSANMAPVVSKFSFSANMDFSDIQNSQLPGISHENQRSSSNEMNLMDFLNH